MLDKIEKDKCTGCGTCALICPQKCISMQNDREGFWYPVLRTKDCIKCGLCNNVCPVLSEKRNEEQKSPVAYAAYGKNEQIRLESTSGGIFTLIAEWILDLEGVVFGAAFDEQFDVMHIAVENRNDLYKLRGSKYVQSDLGDSYWQVKEFLAKNRYVLFCGTPCQIAGLKAYLKMDYHKLYCQEIICHGVPSPLIWEKYKNYRIQKAHSPLKGVSFRNKREGWKQSSLVCIFDNKKEYHKTIYEDSYMQAFLKNITLRPSCYQCSFKGENRFADIVLADFWGIESLISGMDDDKGTSLIIVRTKKGKEMFDSIKKDMIWKEVSYLDAAKINISYLESVPLNKNRTGFFNELEQLDYKNLTKKYSRDSLKKVVRRKLRKWIRMLLKKTGIYQIIRGRGIKMKMGYRVIVAHPGKQHSYHLAAALKREGMLLRYITTVYDKKNSFLMHIGKLFLNKENVIRANTRKSDILDDRDVVQFHEFGGLIELLLMRLMKKRLIFLKIHNRWNQRLIKKFGIKTAKYAIKQKADAVILFDTNAFECFEYLKKRAPGIIRILDTASAGRFYMKKIFELKDSNTGSNALRKDSPELWDERAMHRLELELKNTQYVLAASKFVRKSIIYGGFPKNCVFIVPYGIDRKEMYEKSSWNDHLNFLFVGQIRERKGVRYLLQAFSELNEPNVSLTLVGAIADSGLYHQYKDNPGIHFCGFVTKDKISEFYQSADVFVFPSLSEGMTLSGIEALGNSLPVICTMNSGINDFIKNGENGFVIPAGDKDGIKEKVLWFVDHKTFLPGMSKRAYETAQTLTWDNYERNMAECIRKICSKSEKC